MLPLLIPIAAALAPEAFKAIGKALAGPRGSEVGGQLGGAIRAAFGTDDPKEVARIAEENPQAATDFRVRAAEIAAQERTAELNARLKDVQHARMIGTKSNLIAWTQVLLSAFIVLSFVGLIWYMIVYGIPQESSEFFILAVSHLSAAFLAVFNFFIGASTSGHSANNVIASMAAKNREVDKSTTTDDLNDKEAARVGAGPFSRRPQDRK